MGNTFPLSPIWTFSTIYLFLQYLVVHPWVPAWGEGQARYLPPKHVYFCKIKIEARRKYANHILTPKIKMILKNAFYPEHKII
jgi:hypothetical protein